MTMRRTRSGADDGKAATLTDRERLDRLRLIRSENVGPRTFRMLLDRYGTAERALAALPSLARRGGASAPRICTLDAAERELAVAQAQGAVFVALGEESYPHRLAMIDDAPP